MLTVIETPLHMPAGDPPAPDPSRDALFLDFDGTLVPLAPRPEAVVVEASLIERLHMLNHAFAGRLALISGRSIDVLDGFGLTGLACAGSHGAEWRLPDGTCDALPRPGSLNDAKSAFVAFAETRDGVLFEDKPLGAALHFRLAPTYEADCVALAMEHAAGLHVQHGHAMIELRVPGVHKGTAITKFMELPPFAGSRAVFAGDDVTDEDGFAAAVQADGHGILVGAARESRARFRLPDPESVNAWLARAFVIAG